MKTNPSFDPSLLGDKRLPRPVRAGVVGLGRIGWRHHAATILYHNGFELCAVCDLEKQRADEAAASAGCAGYTDYAHFLAHPGLELVIVASQSQAHEAHALQALRAGRHVLCEKPACRSPGGMQRLSEAAREAGRLLSVHHNQRVYPELLAVQEVLADGRLGEVFRIHRCVSSFTRRNDWQVLRKYNGGLVSNWGTHIVDQALYLADSEPESVWGELRQVFNPGDTEDDMKAVIRCRSGVVLDLDVSYVDASRRPSWVVQGSRGTLWIQEDKLYVRWLQGRIPPLAVQDGPYATGATFGVVGGKDALNWKEECRAAIPLRRHEGVYDNLYRAIREGAPLLVSPDSALRTYQTLAKIRRSAASATARARKNASPPALPACQMKAVHLTDAACPPPAVCQPAISACGDTRSRRAGHRRQERESNRGMV